MTVFEPCPMSTAPWCSTSGPSARSPTRIVEGFGSAVLPQPYQHEATPTPRRGRLAASASARRQCGRSASRQAPIPTPRSTWPVAVASPSRSAFRMRNSSRSIPALRRQPVDQRLLRDRRLRHAEAAERAGDRPVGVNRAGAGADMRHRGRGRWHAPAPGSPPSAPSSHRRRCRTPPRSRAPSAGRPSSQPSRARHLAPGGAWWSRPSTSGRV